MKHYCKECGMELYEQVIDETKEDWYCLICHEFGTLEELTEDKEEE